MKAITSWFLGAQCHQLFSPCSGMSFSYSACGIYRARAQRACTAVQYEDSYQLRLKSMQIHTPVLFVSFGLTIWCKCSLFIIASFYLNLKYFSLNNEKKYLHFVSWHLWLGRGLKILRTSIWKCPPS